MAIGTDSRATSTGGVALGSGSLASRAGLGGQAEAFSGNTVASTAGGVSVGAAGAERQIVNVAGGTQGTDAINLRQLSNVGSRLAGAIGGGAGFDATTGVFSGPSFAIRGAIYTDVGSALGAVDSELARTSDRIDTVSREVATLRLGSSGGGDTLVTQATPDAPIRVGSATGGTKVDVSGTAGARRLSGVAQGIDGTDAVNRGQLDAALQTLDARFADIPLRSDNTSGRAAPVSSGRDSYASGYGARATGTNSLAIGAGATTTRANQVAIGSSGSSYTLAGIGSAQSRAAQGTATRFVTADASGNLATSDYGPSSIAGLQGQMGALGNQVSGLSQYVVRSNREARQGVSAAMAMTSASMPSLPGKTSWTVNSATFRGEWAGGVALAHRLDAPIPIAVTAGFSYSEANRQGARVGLAGEF